MVGERMRLTRRAPSLNDTAHDGGATATTTTRHGRGVWRTAASSGDAGKLSSVQESAYGVEVSTEKERERASGTAHPSPIKKKRKKKKKRAPFTLPPPRFTTALPHLSLSLSVSTPSAAARDSPTTSTLTNNL